MEQLLERYLKIYKNLEYVGILTYGIGGALCLVEYCTDEAHTTKETEHINIWDFVMFMASQNNSKIIGG